MKNPFKKKEKFPTQSAPRPFAEIQKDYSKLAFDLGQAQYQVIIYSKAVERLAGRMKEVNLEAEQRNTLDQQAKADAAKLAETKASELAGAANE